MNTRNVLSVKKSSKQVSSLKHPAHAMRNMLKGGHIPQYVAFGDLVFDTVFHKVTQEGADILISPGMEYNLLFYLMLHAVKGDTVSISEIKQYLYGEQTLKSNPVSVFISRIRAKLAFVESTVELKKVTGRFKLKVTKRSRRRSKSR